jgi:protocatechuate 3,4-dioxygenase beta subunit
MSKRAPLLLVAAVAVLGVLALALWSREDGERGVTAPTAGTAAVGTDAGDPAIPRDPEAPGEAARLAQGTEPTGAKRASIGSEDMRLIEGVVVLPEGTPADEKVLVLSLDRAYTVRDIYGRESMASAAWDQRFENEGLLAFAEVEADGRFEIAVPKDAEEAFLAVSGRYAYSGATTVVDLAEEARATLAAELGAWITGSLRAPVGATAEEARQVGVEVELGPDITGGFEAMSMQQIAFTMETETSAEGTFEFRGVPCALVHGVSTKPETLAAHVELGLETEPGEHLQLELELVRGGTIEGRVVDAAGKGLADADVAVFLPGTVGQAIDELRETETDESGAFVLANVTPGEVEVRAELDGYRAGTQRIEGGLTDGLTVRGIELVLDEGASITGFVRFADGAPASGASVRAAIDFSSIGPMGFAGIDTRDGGRTETAEDGSFTVSGLGDGTFQVVAFLEEAEDGGAPRWSARQGGVKGDADPIELVLEREATVVGIVLDVAGEVVPEFTVHGTLKGSGAMMGIGAERRSWGASEEGDGTFEANRLRRGAWELLVQADGYGKSALQTVEVPRGEDAPMLRFELQPAARIGGIVLGTTGEPVSGARVQLEQDLADRLSSSAAGDAPSTMSDAEGRYLLDGLDPGPTSVYASHDGFAASAPVPVDAVSGEVVEDVTLTLRVGGRLTGEVFGKDGEPAVGLMVMVQKVPNYNTQHMLTSDADGRFERDHLEPGTWQVVAMGNFLTGEAEIDSTDESEAMAEMLGDLKMDMVDIVDGETAHVVLGKPPEDPVLLRGRVVHSGEGIANAAVSVVPEGMQGMSDLKMAFTKEDGTFEVQLDKGGPTLVTVQHAMTAGQQNSIEFLERIPTDVDEYELELDMPHGRISGLVRGPDGELLRSCRITLNVEGGVAYGSFMGGHYTETITDDDGKYDIPYLRPGNYTVSAGGTTLGGLLGEASAGGRVVRSGIEVAEGAWVERVDFDLPESAELTGVVKGPDGKPAADASVFVRHEDGQLLERFSLVTTDATGRYTYKGLAPGRYSIVAKRGNDVSEESDLVRVDEGGQAEAHVTLSAGTIVRVTVVDEEDLEIRARISVTGPNGLEVSGMLSLSEIMETFGQGFSSKEQRIGPLSPGRYSVVATLDDGRRAKKTVKLSGKPERVVKLRAR